MNYTQLKNRKLRAGRNWDKASATLEAAKKEVERLEAEYQIAASGYYEAYEVFEAFKALTKRVRGVK